MIITPVILAGGTGKRLWPLSTRNRPKQFLKLASSRTMLAETLQRVAMITDALPVIVGNAAHQSWFSDYDAELLKEPFMRNTGPAIALAALKMQQKDPDALLLICPADHVIQRADIFERAVQHAVMQAQNGRIVLFGVLPHCAEKRYGYIKMHEDNFEKFVEKPDRKTAEIYFRSGSYLWNSGIFLAKAETLLEAYQNHAPELLEAVKLYYETDDAEHWERCPSISFDYAILEKTDRIFCSRLENAGWTDLGSWSALLQYWAKRLLLAQ